MNSFRTIFPKFYSKLNIDHTNSLFCIGSCFTQEIGNYLKSYQFNINYSPFGIVFNPLSMADQLKKIINNYNYSELELLSHNGLYHSLDHHGSYSRIDPIQMIKELNEDISKARDAISQAHFLIITFGSAHYYSTSPEQKIVANCHKLPSTYFLKKRGEYSSLLEPWKNIIQELQIFNPNLKIILSISPIRYIRDGFVENTRSKAVLVQLVEGIQSIYSNVDYFPAYEIFMDDLRDYRFAKEDLIHPNSMAIEYIWEYFSNAYFKEKTNEINHCIKEINSLLNHKSLHPESQGSSLTKNVLNNKVTEFKKKYPEIPLNFT